MTVEQSLDVLGPEELIGLLFAGGPFSGNPYPIYDRLRPVAPIHRTTFGTWVLSRHDDIAGMLRDVRLGRDFGSYLNAGPGLRDAWESSPILKSQAHWMLNLHPPDHTRVRRLFAKTFTPSRVEHLRPHVAALVDELLADAADRESFDIVADFAFQLPVTVIGELLGVPREDRQHFLEWTQHISASVEPVRPPDVLERADRAVVAYEGYFRSLIAERRRTPRDDLLSALIVVRDEDGSALSEDELVANSILLFSAGFDTTMNLIGNGVLALASSPDQYRALRADQELVAGAIEEILRYDGSAQLADRTVLEEFDLGGHRLSAGDTVIFLLGSGNRDPLRYESADRLDIRRTDVKPLTFGGGIHYCLGSALARMEAQVAFVELTRRFDVPQLIDAEPQYRPTLTNHGLRRLDVTWR